MSRRKRVYKKEERVDSRYGSPAVARLITTVMKCGKKSLAERIVYTAIDKSREGSDSVDPLEVLFMDRLRQIEIVIESVLDGRADGVLDVGKKFADRLRHQMRRTMP